MPPMKSSAPSAASKGPIKAKVGASGTAKAPPGFGALANAKAPPGFSALASARPGQAAATPRAARPAAPAPTTPRSGTKKMSGRPAPSRAGTTAGGLVPKLKVLGGQPTAGQFADIDPPVTGVQEDQDGYQHTSEEQPTPTSPGAIISPAGGIRPGRKSATPRTASMNANNDGDDAPEQEYNPRSLKEQASYEQLRISYLEPGSGLQDEEVQQGRGSKISDSIVGRRTSHRRKSLPPGVVAATRVLEAARAGDVTTLSELCGTPEVFSSLEQIEDEFARAREFVVPNVQDVRWRTPLMYAAGFGRVEAVEFFLEDPLIAINVRDDTSKTALMFACRSSSTLMHDPARAFLVQRLLEEDGDIGAMDTHGDSALSIAVDSGDRCVTKVLLNYCETENYEGVIARKDYDGVGLLDICAVNGDVKMGCLLLRTGALELVDGDYPQFAAAVRKYDFEFAEDMEAYGEDGGGIANTTDSEELVENAKKELERAVGIVMPGVGGGPSSGSRKLFPYGEGADAFLEKENLLKNVTTSASYDSGRVSESHLRNANDSDGGEAETLLREEEDADDEFMFGGVLLAAPAGSKQLSRRFRSRLSTSEILSPSLKSNLYLQLYGVPVNDEIMPQEVENFAGVQKEQLPDGAETAIRVGESGDQLMEDLREAMRAASASPAHYALESLRCALAHCAKFADSVSDAEKAMLDWDTAVVQAERLVDQLQLKTAVLLKLQKQLQVFTQRYKKGEDLTEEIMVLERVVAEAEAAGCKREANSELGTAYSMLEKAVRRKEARLMLRQLAEKGDFVEFEKQLEKYRAARFSSMKRLSEKSVRGGGAGATSRRGAGAGAASQRAFQSGRMTGASAGRQTGAAMGNNVSPPGFSPDAEVVLTATDLRTFEDLLSNFKSKAKAESALQQQMDKRPTDVDALKSALAAGKVAGLGEELLAQAEKILEVEIPRKEAVDALKQAMAKGIVEQVELALSRCTNLFAVSADADANAADRKLYPIIFVEAPGFLEKERTKMRLKQEVEDLMEATENFNAMKATEQALGDANVTDAKTGRQLSLATDFENDEVLALIAILRSYRDRIQICFQACKIAGIPESALSMFELRKKKLHNFIEDLKGAIRVFIRVRPLSTKEKKNNETEVTRGLDLCTIEVGHQPGDTPSKALLGNLTQFTFDSCFFPGSQEQIFDDSRDLIQSAFDGYNVTVFAYGQTGAGKTYTMSGATGEDAPLSEKGIVPRTCEEVFRIKERDSTRFRVTVAVSMIELYCAKFTDLMKEAAPAGGKVNPGAGAKAKPVAKAGKDIDINVRIEKDGTVRVENAREQQVESAAQMLALIEGGFKNRSVASTKMNSESSRSHLITTISLVSVNLETKAKTAGKLLLCDLAGSERLAKSGAEGQAQKEAIEINKSLTALGDVIEALTKAGANAVVPYRNHKLTQLMQDSLGGTAKTLMFVNCSPAASNIDETVNALKWAKRAKGIVNKR